VCVRVLCVCVCVCVCVFIKAYIRVVYPSYHPSPSSPIPSPPAALTPTLSRQLFSGPGPLGLGPHRLVAAVSPGSLTGLAAAAAAALAALCRTRPTPSCGAQEPAKPGAPPPPPPAVGLCWVRVDANLTDAAAAGRPAATASVTVGGRALGEVGVSALPVADTAAAAAAVAAAIHRSRARTAYTGPSAPPASCCHGRTPALLSCCSSASAACSGGARVAPARLRDRHRPPQLRRDGVASVPCSVGHAARRPAAPCPVRARPH
jgi:hypothetical protein